MSACQIRNRKAWFADIFPLSEASVRSDASAGLLAEICIGTRIDHQKSLPPNSHALQGQGDKGFPETRPGGHTNPAAPSHPLSRSTNGMPVGLLGVMTGL